jgi:hypothetical protein
MADYFEHTVIQQIIPDRDMTRLERLLLSRIFDGERDGEGWFFHTGEGPVMMISATRAELDQALAASTEIESTAHAYIAERLAAADADAAKIDLDLSGTSWEFFIQDIVKRSGTLRYVSIVTAFTCSRMRPGGFGGMAVLITPEAIVGKSTSDLIEDFLAEAGLHEVETADATFSKTAPACDVSAPLARMEARLAHTRRNIAKIERRISDQAEKETVRRRSKRRQYGRHAATWTGADEAAYQRIYHDLADGPHHAELNRLKRKAERQDRAVMGFRLKHGVNTERPGFSPW